MQTVTLLVLLFLIAFSRNENADAALPPVLESNGKSPTATTHVMPDEESDAELDRYESRNW